MVRLKSSSWLKILQQFDNNKSIQLCKLHEKVQICGATWWHRHNNGLYNKQQINDNNTNFW